jgi:hypothetical protein
MHIRMQSHGVVKGQIARLSKVLTRQFLHQRGQLNQGYLQGVSYSLFNEKDSPDQSLYFRREQYVQLHLRNSKERG